VIARFFAKRRLTRARADYARAEMERDRAEERRDSRSLHAARQHLRIAHLAVLKAEAELFPMPPLPRPGAAKPKGA